MSRRDDSRADDDCFPTIRLLAEYEVWCNTRLLDAAGSLAPGRLGQEFPFGLRSIHATLFHIVEVFQIWGGCVGPDVAQGPAVPYDPRMPLAELVRWNDELARAFLGAIDASHGAGLLHADRRLVQVFHLVTHGTHHRTQVITMLRLLGIDPPFEAGDFAGWQRGR